MTTSALAAEAGPSGPSQVPRVPVDQGAGRDPPALPAQLVRRAAPPPVLARSSAWGEMARPSADMQLSPMWAVAKEPEKQLCDAPAHHKRQRACESCPQGFVLGAAPDDPPECRPEPVFEGTPPDTCQIDMFQPFITGPCEACVRRGCNADTGRCYCE